MSGFLAIHVLFCRLFLAGLVSCYMALLFYVTGMFV
jgi:hypothetical protein